MAAQTQASTEVVQRTPVQQVVAQIRGIEFKEQIALALPSGVSPDRFQRIAVTAIMQNPEVVVDPPSLFQAVIRCAQDGLMPDGREAALVVFGGKVQYMSMIGGLRKIAANHGFSLEAYVVYANDEFAWELGFNPSVTHVPPKLDQPRGEAIGAYSVATLQSTGQKFLEVMSRGEIEDVRKVSKAANGPAWTKNWGEMSRKTVARRNFKQLPLGDIDEVEDRIIRQADVDVEHDNGPRLSIDEANVAAGLTGVSPPTDAGPDDRIATTMPTAEQHGELLQLVVQLTDQDPETDWRQHALDYARDTFQDRALVQFDNTEMEQVLNHLREQLPQVIT